MGRSEIAKYSPELFETIAKASEGQIRVEVDGVFKTFLVSRAEVRDNDIVLNFDMSGGDPDFNHFIGIVINKNLLAQRVDFTESGKPVYFLFQNATQEWLAASGWIRVEWQEGGKKITGLLDNVRSDRPENSNLSHGKFEVTLS